MSSSETQERLELPFLPDLQVEVPAPDVEDFSDQQEFDTVAPATLPPITAEEARRSGFAEGEVAGRASAWKEVEPVAEELRALASGLARVQTALLSDAEAEIVRVALETARHVLRGELSQPEDTVVRMARACIQAAEPEGEAVLHCAQADVELLRVHVPELESELADLSLCVRADASLTAGGVVLEARGRFYDGRPERLLDRVEPRESSDSPTGEEA